MKQVALITGASSGIGLETAKNYLNKGYAVYGAARRPDDMQEFQSLGGRCIHLDITEEDSIKQCVEEIMRQEGRIDILVNNAGYGMYGPMENTPMDEVRRQFEVNFFGLVRLVQLVVPVMRKQKSGTIVNISSMGGRFTVPFGGWYHASKYAVESYSDSLRQELSAYGIKVIIIEPGMIQTSWGTIAAKNTRKIAQDNSFYQDNLNRYADYLDRYYTNQKKLVSPKHVADVITRATSRRHPRTRYPVGMTAHLYLAFRRMLSDRIFDAMCIKSIGLQL